jgi:hypothetical protein
VHLYLRTSLFPLRPIICNAPSVNSSATLIVLSLIPFFFLLVYLTSVL